MSSTSPCAIELKLFEEQARIMTAEAEAVAHGCGDSALFGFVGGVVQVATFLGVIEVDGGGDEVSLDDQCADDGFHAARCTQEVAQFAFGGADGEFCSVFAEDGFE